MGREHTPNHLKGKFATEPSGFGQLGDRAGLIQVRDAARGLRLDAPRARALAAVACALADLAEVPDEASTRQGADEALRASERCQYEESRLEAFVAVVRPLVRLGLGEELPRVLAAAEPTRGTPAHVELLASVATASMASGDVEGARKEVRRALDAATRLEDIAKSSAALTTVLPTLARLDDRAGLADALNAAMAINSDFGGAYWRQGAMHEVANALASMTLRDSRSASELVFQATERARPRGRHEMLGCIAAFAPVLTSLGVLQATWQTVQRADAMLVSEPAAVH
jgi:hypothetical protein